MFSSKDPGLPAKSQQQKGEFVWKKKWERKELGPCSMGTRERLQISLLDMRKTADWSIRKAKPEMGISGQNTWEENLGKKTMLRAAGGAGNLWALLELSAWLSGSTQLSRKCLWATGLKREQQEKKPSEITMQRAEILEKAKYSTHKRRTHMEPHPSFCSLASPKNWRWKYHFTNANWNSYSWKCLSLNNWEQQQGWVWRHSGVWKLRWKPLRWEKPAQMGWWEWHHLAESQQK